MQQVTFEKDNGLQHLANFINGMGTIIFLNGSTEAVLEVLL